MNIIGKNTIDRLKYLNLDLCGDTFVMVLVIEGGNLTRGPMN